MLFSVIFGFAAVSLAFGAGWLWHKTKKILAIPVVTVSEVAGQDNTITVAGRAGGSLLDSPWTGQSGLLFDATHNHRRVVYGWGGDSHSLVDSHHLGTTGTPDFYLTDNGESLEVAVSEHMALRHLPARIYEINQLEPKLKNESLPAALTSSLDENRSEVRRWITETCVDSNVRLWVTGEVISVPGAKRRLGGQLTVSGEEPSEHVSFLLKTTAGLAGAAAVSGGLAVLSASNLFG